MRKAFPILMTLTVALVGCTTNRTPGNGQPTTDRPNFTPANTYGTSSGSVPVNPPMTSSYQTPAATSSAADRAAYAADIMRQHQQFQPRFLGYLNPEPRAQQPVQQYVNGQYVNGQYIQSPNPEMTVNSSISSQPVPVFANGDVTLTTVDTGTTLTTPTASGVVTAPLATAGATVGTGTTRILTPTMSSGAMVSPLVVGGAATPVNPSMASASTGVVTTPVVTSPSTLNTNITAPLTVTTTPTGGVMITNTRSH